MDFAVKMLWILTQAPADRWCSKQGTNFIADKWMMGHKKAVWSPLAMGSATSVILTTRVDYNLMESLERILGYYHHGLRFDSLWLTGKLKKKKRKSCVQVQKFSLFICNLLVTCSIYFSDSFYHLLTVLYMCSGLCKCDGIYFSP